MARDPHSRQCQLALSVLKEATGAGKALLNDGASALDVAQHCVRDLEFSGAFHVGRGSRSNPDGHFELAAALFDGARGRGLGIAQTRNALSGVVIARHVFESVRESLVLGAAVREICGESRLYTSDPQAYFSPLKFDESFDTPGDDLFCVGAAVVDVTGKCASAAATSDTGGRDGYIGSTSVLGAGIWADDRTAISCAGAGRDLIELCAARDISLQVQLKGDTLASTVSTFFRELGQQREVIGIIGASSTETSSAFRGPAFLRSWINGDGDLVSTAS